MRYFLLVRFCLLSVDWTNFQHFISGNGFSVIRITLFPFKVFTTSVDLDRLGGNMGNASGEFGWFPFSSSALQLLLITMRLFKRLFKQCCDINDGANRQTRTSDFQVNSFNFIFKVRFAKVCLVKFNNQLFKVFSFRVVVDVL